MPGISFAPVRLFPMNRMRRGPPPKWLSGGGSVDMRHELAMPMIAQRNTSVRSLPGCPAVDMPQFAVSLREAAPNGDDPIRPAVGRRPVRDDSFRPGR